MQNRTALITGASRGIGRECALALSRSGARVALAARRMDLLEQLASEISAQGREAFPMAMDLASADSIREGCSRAVKEFGRIDILVNNAGVTRDGLAMRLNAKTGRCAANESSGPLRHPAVLPA